jgi:hypothetical protein
VHFWGFTFFNEYFQKTNFNVALRISFSSNLTPIKIEGVLGMQFCPNGGKLLKSKVLGDIEK